MRTLYNVCIVVYTQECFEFLYYAFNITVAVDLLQNAFGVDIADKTQADLYKLEQPLEVCNDTCK